MDNEPRVGNQSFLSWLKGLSVNATGYWKKKPAGNPLKQSQSTSPHLWWGVGNHLLLKQSSNSVLPQNPCERSTNTRPSCWTLPPNQVNYYKQLLINRGGRDHRNSTVLQTEGREGGREEELACMPEQRHHQAKGQGRYGRIRGLMDTTQQC